jgi:hypothetical protein
MVKIRNLPMEPSVRDWLRDDGIRTSDDLWREIGSRFSRGLAGTAKRTRIAPGRLLHALGAAAAAEREWRLSTGEALLGLALLALLALAGLRVAEALGLQAFPLPPLTARVDQLVVVPRGGLPAFHVLSETDLRPAPRSRIAGGVTRKADVLGRYLLRPLAVGAVVRASDVGAVKLPAAVLAGRRIVTLHVDAAALGPQVTPGTEASLVLAPKPGVVRVAVDAEVVVLSVEKDAGGRAVVAVAIAPERWADVATALGSSEVFLAR